MVTSAKCPLHIQVPLPSLNLLLIILQTRSSAPVKYSHSILYFSSLAYIIIFSYTHFYGYLINVYLPHKTKLHEDRHHVYFCLILSQSLEQRVHNKHLMSISWMNKSDQ